jgi:ElaB/YqjD/DUF883 family membrane-anchored ribosome-binding protein
MGITGKSNQVTANDDSRTGAVDGASAAVHQAVDRIANAARPAVDRIALSAHQAVDRVAGATSAAAETFALKKTQINTMGAELIDGSRSYVRTKPLVSIGIAVAAGFILSRLFGPR